MPASKKAELNLTGSANGSMQDRITFLNDQAVKNFEKLRADQRQDMEYNFDKMLKCLELFDKYVEGM